MAVVENLTYTGDALLQKTMVEDFLTHRLVKNNGRLPQYYVEDSHPPVVPKAVFFRARTARRLRSWDNDALVRVLEKVVPCGATTFKGGVEVKNGT